MWKPQLLRAKNIYSILGKNTFFFLPIYGKFSFDLYLTLSCNGLAICPWCFPAQSNACWDRNLHLYPPAIGLIQGVHQLPWFDDTVISLSLTVHVSIYSLTQCRLLVLKSGCSSVVCAAQQVDGCQKPLINALHETKVKSRALAVSPTQPSVPESFLQELEI